MLEFLYKQKIQTNLFLLISILLTGMIVFGVLSFLTLQEVKIKGPYYNKIITANELISDILPPPAYIIESYLTAFEQMFAANKTSLDKLIERSRRLHKEFDERHQYWSKHISEELDKRLQSIFIVQSDKIVQEFFTILDNQFIPALLAGNKEEAQKLLLGPLSEKYAEHRAIIDEVVVSAKKSINDLEAQGDTLYAQSTQLTWSLWVFTFIVGILFAWIISLAITKRLHDITSGIVPISVEISKRMDLQTESVAQQSSAVQETTATMNELSVSFKHTESLAQESSDRAKNALRLSDEGNTVLKQMLENLGGHKEKVSAIVEQIMHLSELIHQIHNIASVTSNLTNQTNILALNAAVQAVHVKQQSEGFSVIASEIRKLADDSKKFLSHIDALADNIQKATNSTITIAEEGSRTIQEIIRLGHNTSKAFDTIMSITSTSYEAAEQVALNVRQQGLAVNQVSDAMENLIEASHQTSHGLKQVRNELGKLNEIAQNLKSIA